MELKIRELINYLNARNEEYDKGHPTISDKEYDDKYFELIHLEQDTGIIFEDSPTQKINYKVVSNLKKVKHNHPMLSLEKTKNIDTIKSFVGNKDFLCMFKMDGLTCSLKYDNGRLISAETRGNGYEGEDITHNAMVMESIPNCIDYKDELVIDGEVICPIDVFDERYSDEYKNPRNFAAGSIRLLDAEESHHRSLMFVAWNVIKGMENLNKISERLKTLSKFNFFTVPYIYSNDINWDNVIDNSIESANNLYYPIDGLVFKFDDVEYGKSLGATEHHFKDAIALKFYDEEYESKLLNIEYTMGRTGILTPVAVFEKIDIDGCEVERASLHNLSIMKETLGETPYMYQKVWVSKRNMIIPQIERSGKDICYIQDLLIDIPYQCPICGGKVEQITENESTILMCVNPSCEGKFLNRLEHFCSKKGLDIKGLSIMTLEKLIAWGWIENIKDIFVLKEHRDEWIKKPGFGVASVDKILNSIEESRHCEATTFITSLGIPLIGNSVAKSLMSHYFDYWDFRKAVEEKFDFSKFDGFAESKTLALWKFNYEEADEIYKNYIYSDFVTVIKDNITEDAVKNCDGLKFVITGKVSHYKNRDELKSIIESRGGKVIDSVSKNTNYLINNDVNSTTGKNQTAKKLSVPIISEEEFIKKFIENM